MSERLSALHSPIDAGLGGVLVANMLEAWLAGNPDGVSGAEAANELQDHRTTPEQTGLYLCPAVDECPSAPPPGEHGAPVCTASDGAGNGLERIGDSHPRPGPGNDRQRDDQAGGFQDFGYGCLDGTSGCGVCTGSFQADALESGLASAAGVVRAYCHVGDRRRWLLRSVRFQRRPSARAEGDNGASRASFFARAPPGREAQQSEKRRTAFSASGGLLL